MNVYANRYPSWHGTSHLLIYKKVLLCDVIRLCRRECVLFSLRLAEHPINNNNNNNNNNICYLILRKLAYIHDQMRITNNEKEMYMFLSLKLIKKRVKFMYTYEELKIICKSKIVSFQLSLKNKIIVLHSNVLR